MPLQMIKSAGLYLLWLGGGLNDEKTMLSTHLISSDGEFINFLREPGTSSMKPRHSSSGTSVFGLSVSEKRPELYPFAVHGKRIYKSKTYSTLKPPGVWALFSAASYCKASVVDREEWRVESDRRSLARWTCALIDLSSYNAVEQKDQHLVINFITKNTWRKDGRSKYLQPFPRSNHQWWCQLLRRSHCNLPDGESLPPYCGAITHST